MGVEPPFIYDKPSTYTFGGPTDRGFNPRAATRASWTPQGPKSKPDGPLIDFNKHPDTYLIVPYGNLSVEPMSPKTRRRVVVSRRSQLALRSVSLLAALGLLFCVITINRTSGSVGWLIRVAPAVALLHSIYGIHHLCRAATGRTAASSASYMVFAAIMDAGLIPFLVLSALLAHGDYTVNAYGWSTLFNTDRATYDVIYAFFWLNIGEAGIALVSFCLDLYLAVLFRQIAKLPPDMNPLEPNLTARPNKHKRNKSEMSVTEKNMSRSSLAIKTEPVTSTKRIPFVHTRTDSANSVTVYGNDSARQSRVSFRKELDQQDRGEYRQSQLLPESPVRPSCAVITPKNSGSPGNGVEYKPARSSGLSNSRTTSPERPASWLSYIDYEGMPTDLSETASEQLDKEIRPLSPVSVLSERDMIAERRDNERQNWYEAVAPARHSQGYLPQDNNYQDRSARVVSPLESSPKRRSREPLGMNPPTPRLPFHHENASNSARFKHEPLTPSPERQALQEANANLQSRPHLGARPSSFVGSGGKTRFYGTLRSSIGSIHGNDIHKEHEAHVEEVDSYGRTTTMSTDDSGNFQIHADGSDDEPLAPPPANHFDHNNATGWNGTRQTSNSTAVDLQHGYAGLGPEFGLGMGRRREVSGKVAEEGRSINAAGWARFKGL